MREHARATAQRSTARQFLEILPPIGHASLSHTVTERLLVSITVPTPERLELTPLQGGSQEFESPQLHHLAKARPTRYDSSIVRHLGG